MGKMGLNSVGDEGECVATLLATGFDHRQHRFDERMKGTN
jgi:hypothetical protein